MTRSRLRGLFHLKNYSGDHVRIAIMILVWLLMGLLGLGMDILEFKLWLMYVM